MHTFLLHISAQIKIIWEYKNVNMIASDYVIYSLHFTHGEKKPEEETTRQGSPSNMETAHFLVSAHSSLFTDLLLTIFYEQLLAHVRKLSSF